MEAGVLPVKAFAQAKTRLASEFDASARERIARALFDDALSLIDSVERLRWWIVSDEPEVLRAAEARGLQSLEDEGRGLNEALERAVEIVTAAGATSLTIVPADVPLAWRGDIDDLLDTGATSDIVVVPSEADGGTNAIYLDPPGAVPLRFGPGSLREHLAAAEQRGLRCSLLSLPRLALDLDTPDDAHALLQRGSPAPSRTLEVLTELLPAKS